MIGRGTFRRDPRICTCPDSSCTWTHPWDPEGEDITLHAETIDENHPEWEFAEELTRKARQMIKKPRESQESKTDTARFSLQISDRAFLIAVFVPDKVRITRHLDEDEDEDEARIHQDQCHNLV